MCWVDPPSVGVEIESLNWGSGEKSGSAGRERITGSSREPRETSTEHEAVPREPGRQRLRQVVGHHVTGDRVAVRQSTLRPERVVLRDAGQLHLRADELRPNRNTLLFNQVSKG